MKHILKFKEFVNESADTNIKLDEATENWSKVHDEIVYDLEQILDRCYKFEDTITVRVKPAELNKAKAAHKKLEEAIRVIINSL